MSVRLLSLTCSRCSAPLEVPDDVKFVTCGHCGASLGVDQHGGAYFTRELQELAETAKRIDEKVDELHAAMVDQREQQDWTDEQAQALLGGSNEAFRSIGMIQKIMTGVMSVPVAAFFLYVGWQFHPIIGVVMASIPLLGGLSFVLVRHQITSRLGQGLNGQTQRERGDEHGD